MTEGRRETTMTRRSSLMVSGAALMMIALGAVDSTAATCDRACLLQQAKQFNANMLAHTPNKIPLASGAQIRENTEAIALADSK